MLEMQQTGQYIPTDAEEAANEQLAQTPVKPIPGPGPGFQNFRLPRGGAMRNESLGLEAAAEGYGQSRYDQSEFVPGEDLENKRAIAQPDFWKVANGAIKGGIYAGTTAVNTVAGVIDGLLEGTGELVRQAGDGERISVPKAVGAGVNNFTSRTMADIQRLSDEWFPNYRTTEERSDEYQQDWIKHIFTANFIGDSFLKNFGFTVGALAGGAAWSKALGAALSGSLSSNLMKGVTAAAEGSETAKAALQNALGMIRNGSAVAIDDAAIAKNFINSAKELNKFGTKMQLFGSVIGAMGEGTTEGVNARNEFMDKYLTQLDDEFIQNYRGLEDKLIEQYAGTDLVKSVPVLNADGTTRMVPRLNDNGLARLELERQRMASDYRDRRACAEEQGDRLAATTFLLNLPILTISNTVQFGRMLSGGWKTARKTAKVAGSLGDYSATGSIAGRTLQNALKVGASESSEEMLQGVVSSGATRVADDRIASYNNDGYDRDVMKSYGDWFTSMYQGGREYLADWKNWQEGFMGLVTGLVGMPGRTWNGGLAEAYRDAKEDKEASQAAADILNNTVNSKKFQDAWKSYVRHMKYENQMENAAKNDDPYAWKTANDKQLIGDIMMFANAGRLQDLNDLVDSYANMSDTEADEKGVVEAITSDDNRSEIENNPASSVEKVREQARIIKDNIAKYNELSEAIKARMPIDTSDEQVQEMVSAAMNIKAFEQRYLEMFDDVLREIDPMIQAMPSVKRDNGKFRNKAEILERAKDVRSALAKYFTAVGVPENATLDDLVDVSSVVQELKKENPKVSDETKQKFEHMQKVFEDRKNYVQKLMTLQSMPSEKFEEHIETPKKIETEVKNDAVRQELAGLNGIDDVRQKYFAKDAKGRADFLAGLNSIENDNPVAKQFLGMIRQYDNFRGYIDRNGVDVEDASITPPMLQSVISDVVRRAKSEEDITTLPDSVFPSYAEFARDFTGIFGAPTPAAFASLKNSIRAAMNKYMGKETAVATRNTIKTDQTLPAFLQNAMKDPQGYDPAQPASVEPAPAAKDDTPESAPSDTPVASAPEDVNEERREPVVSETKPEQVVAEAMDVASSDDGADFEEEKVHTPGQKDKLAYYRTGMPEIDSFEAKKARKAAISGDEDAFKAADLSDFPGKNPDFADTWNALEQRGAFENVARRVEVGDEIEFVIDPTFPSYNGQYQILMTTVKDGQRLVLSTLPQQSSKYYGLSELQKAIADEYESFRESNPNDLFVFSKKSKVWLKRPGLMDYDYSLTGEKAIIDIPSYYKDAPIAFINRNGEAEPVRKNSYALNHVSDTFNDPGYNRDHERLGNLYYLVHADKDKWIPIRLNVEHFKDENKDADNPTFNKIREILSEMSGIVREANNQNLDEQNNKLHEKTSELIKLLDLHDAYFEIGNYENVGVAFRYSSPNDDGAIRRPDQMTDNWLINLVAGLDRSIQIKQDSDGKIVNFEDYVEQGLITSNAKMLRPKGTDFYIDPWIPERSEFGPVTDSQINIANEQRTESSSPAPQPTLMEGSFGDRDDFDGLFDNDVPAPREEKGLSNTDVENTLMRRTDGNTVDALVKQKFSELPKQYKDGLVSKGYSESEYDAMGDVMKEKVLRCLGVE